MNIFRSVIACAIALCLHTTALGASAYEACKVMTGKLATVYELFGYPGSFYSSPSKVGDPIGTSESLVTAAFGTIKQEMDKKWEGFFEWSSFTVLTALRRSQSAREFRVDAFQKCVAKYE